MAARKQVDYDRIEAGWRAGLLSPRQLAAAYTEETGETVSHAAIIKHFSNRGVPRDLSAKIHAKADALVTAAMVTGKVTPGTKIPERRIVDEGATMVADVKLAHRHDIHRARGLNNKLMDELEQQSDPATLAKLQELAAAVVAPGEKPGRDRYGELLEAVISLPERSKTLKVLAESLRIVVDMERTAFGMDKVDPGGAGPGEGGVARIAVEFVRPAAREDDDA